MWGFRARCRPLPRTSYFDQCIHSPVLSIYVSRLVVHWPFAKLCYYMNSKALPETPKKSRRFKAYTLSIPASHYSLLVFKEERAVFSRTLNARNISQAHYITAPLVIKGIQMLIWLVLPSPIYSRFRHDTILQPDGIFLFMSNSTLKATVLITVIHLWLVDSLDASQLHLLWRSIPHKLNELSVPDPHKIAFAVCGRAQAVIHFLSQYYMYKKVQTDLKRNWMQHVLW